jgi:hypothetical protein
MMRYVRATIGCIHTIKVQLIRSYTSKAHNIIQPFLSQSIAEIHRFIFKMSAMIHNEMMADQSELLLYQ